MFPEPYLKDNLLVELMLSMYEALGSISSTKIMKCFQKILYLFSLISHRIKKPPSFFFPFHLPIPVLFHFVEEV
jgi:hypothetical protein